MTAKKITLNLSVDETVSLNISSSKIVSTMEIPDIDISEYLNPEESEKLQNQIE